MAQWGQASSEESSLLRYFLDCGCSVVSGLAQYEVHAFIVVSVRGSEVNVSMDGGEIADRYSASSPFIGIQFHLVNACKTKQAGSVMSAVLVETGFCFELCLPSAHKEIGWQRKGSPKAFWYKVG